jgi:hypothetical protein
MPETAVAPPTQAVVPPTQAAPAVESTQPAAAETEGQHRSDGLSEQEHERRLKSGNENEQALRGLSDADYAKWRETGKLPLKEAASEAPKAGTEKTAEVVRLGSGKTITADDHAAAKKTQSERWNTARDKEGDWAQIDKEAGKIVLCGGDAKKAKALTDFLVQKVHPHLDGAGYYFLREFVRNPEFRQKIENGNADQIIALASEFDRNYKPAKPVKKVSSAPAPADSISGRSTAPVDPIGAALNKGNFTAYQNEANAEDHRRKRGRRA